MKGDNFSPSSGKIILSDGTIFDINDYLYSLLKNLYEENQYIIVYQKRHKMIHLGKYFTLQDKITVPGEDKKTLAGTTGDKYLHITQPIIKTTLSNVDINVYEKITYHGGTPVTPRNHNRNYSDLTHKWDDLVIDPTIDSYGSTIIYNDYVAGGTGIGGTSYGGNSSEIEEYVFPPNTKYCMDIINNNSSSNNIYVLFSWYWTDRIDD